MAQQQVFNDLGGGVCQGVALAKTHPSLLWWNSEPVVDLTGLNFTENAPPVDWHDDILHIPKRKTAPDAFAAANVISRNQHQSMQLLPVDAIKAAATGQ